MSNGYGMLSHVGISMQQSFGTAFTGSFFWHKAISETLTTEKPLIRTEGNQGRFTQGNAFSGEERQNGDIVTEVHPILIHQLLQAFTNGTSNATYTDSVYTHTLNPALTADWDKYAALRPATIEAFRDAGSATQYYDMVCNGFNLEIANGALLKATTSWVGGKKAKVAKSTPVYLTGSEFTWNQVSISFANSAGTLVAVDDVVNLTVNATNNLEAMGTLNGAITASRVKRTGGVIIDLSGTLKFENDGQKDVFFDQRVQQVKIAVTGGQVNSGHNGALIFDFPMTRTTEFPDNISGMGTLEVGWAASVEYSENSGTMMTTTIVNTHATLP